NIPSASCNWLEVDLVEKLASTGRVLGIKDSSGNLDYTRLLIKRVGGKISVMQGSELLLLPTLVFGGRGGVLGTANLVPKLFVNLYNSYIKGDMSSAVKLQKLAYKVLDVIYRGSADTFFYNVKYALRKLGVDVGYPRKPYREPSKEEAKEIDNLLNWLKEEKLV
ncbi:MAG TPA: dihydrodipicolinate synthase family protein, partial [Thermoproteales archaeon]|nr:dihydrodipicolinate synthase family protein [Thermoproteales archaeon]